jgi:uncharacterized protein YlaI
VEDSRELNESNADELLVRCAWCERIKLGDEWVDVAEVRAMRLTHDSVGHYSHGICPECYTRLTPPGPPA